MSDEDSEYVYESGSESDYQYDDADEIDEENDQINPEQNAYRDTQIQLENIFYEAEDYLHKRDYELAMEYFKRVVTLENEFIQTYKDKEISFKWSFHAYEKLVRLCVMNQQWKEMIQNYKTMLSFLSTVTSNDSSETISSLIDSVSTTSSLQGSMVDSTDSSNMESEKIQYLMEMYELTLNAAKGRGFDRLCFTMNLKLGKLYLDMKKVMALQKLLRQLYAYCYLDDNKTPDPSKVTSLLEVYALEIQLCGLTKNKKRLQEVYPKTLELDAAISDPRIMGSIREEGGKMYMEERKWMSAYNEFFESFRNYQEAGNSHAVRCLKYVVLANMLASSQINPFDSREAKVYQENEEIAALLMLRSAYEANDITAFDKILNNKRYGLMNDSLMQTYLTPLLRNIRCRVFLKLVRPYSTIQFNKIAKWMHLNAKEVEDIAVELIINDLLQAKVDQIKGLLILQQNKWDRDEGKIFDALGRLTAALENVHAAI